MKQSRDKIRALWCRQLAGEPLQEAERELIDKTLRDDPNLAAELGSDATAHTLLQSLDEVIQTEDDFVRAALQKAMAVPNTDSSTPANAPVATVPTMPPASAPTELPLLVEPTSTRNNAKVRRQRSPQWLAFSLTLILFLAVGLMFWLQSGGPPEIAQTDPAPTENVEHQNPELPPVDDGPKTPENQNVAAADNKKTANDEAPEAPDASPTKVATNDNERPMDNPDTRSPTLPKVPNETPPVVAATQFVTLTKAKNPVWEREETVGAKFGDELVQLLGGSIELTFDDGAVVTLQGPVEFQPRTADQLTLRRGKLSAAVPEKAIGFSVLTPTSEVVDLGTEFEVSVKGTGASDVRVRKGEIEVAPSGLGRTNTRKWKLVPGGLNRASFFARPNDDKTSPIAASVQGANGRFEGIISLNGKTAEFRSASTFNNVHERVLTQLKTSQRNTLREWQQFVDSMRQQMRGSMNFNGRQMQFGNFDEVMRLHNQLRNQAGSNTGNQFSGSININGKEIQFKTREEFEAARKAAFGAAANFGAGDFSNKRRPPR